MDKEHTERITIRVSTTEYEYITDLAEYFNTTQSVVLRMMIRSYIKRNKGV